MSRRADAARRILRWLTQGALFTLWALVGWGTLLLFATALGALRDGLTVALGRLLPGPGAGPWGFLNAASASLAVAAWVVAAGLAFQWRRERAAGAADAERTDESPVEPGSGESDGTPPAE